MISYWETPEAYICERCGHVLEPNETELSYDDALMCNLCGSEDVSAAYRCEICEEMTSENEIEGCEHKVCRSCIEKKRYDLDFCTKVGEECLTEFALNGFLSSFFTESELNELMLSVLKERAKVRPVDGLDYLKYNGVEAGDALFAEVNG